MIDLDELYDLADKARNNPCGYPINQVLDNLDSFTAGITPSVVVELITRLRQAEKDAARYIFIRDEATDYHIGEIHGAWEEDRDDLVDMFIEQLAAKMNQIERAKARMKRDGEPTL